MYRTICLGLVALSFLGVVITTLVAEIEAGADPVVKLHSLLKKETDLKSERPVKPELFDPNDKDQKKKFEEDLKKYQKKLAQHKKDLEATRQQRTTVLKSLSSVTQVRRALQPNNKELFKNYPDVFRDLRGRLETRLEAILGEGDSTTLQATAIMLGEMGKTAQNAHEVNVLHVREALWPMLEQLAQHNEERVRVAALTAMGNLRPRSLELLAKSKNVDIKSAAVVRRDEIRKAGKAFRVTLVAIIGERLAEGSAGEKCVAAKALTSLMNEVEMYWEKLIIKDDQKIDDGTDARETILDVLLVAESGLQTGSTANRLECLQAVVKAANVSRRMEKTLNPNREIDEKQMAVLRTLGAGWNRFLKSSSFADSLSDSDVQIRIRGRQLLEKLAKVHAIYRSLKPVKTKPKLKEIQFRQPQARTMSSKSVRDAWPFSRRLLPIMLADRTGSGIDALLAVGENQKNKDKNKQKQKQDKAAKQKKQTEKKKQDPFLDTLHANAARVAENFADPNVRVRLSGLDFLEHLVETKLSLTVVTDIAKSLQDHDPFVRWSAMRTLGKIGKSRLKNVDDLDIEGKGILTVVLHGLAQVVDPKKERDFDVRLYAASNLRDIGVLVRSAKAHREELTTLAQIATPALLNGAIFSDVETRKASLIALKEIGAGRHVSKATLLLLPALCHSNSDLRRYAAEALGSFGPGAAAAIPALEKLVLDRVSEVRRAASDALLCIRKK